MRKTRGFEVVKGFENEGINLPKRETANAAGYDFEAAEDVVIEPVILTLFKAFWNRVTGAPVHVEKTTDLLKPVLVPTGVKAYMQEDEVLYLYSRSSNPLKRFLLLGNGVGVVDADYYGNEKNDGHIMFQFWNLGLFSVTIKKGDRIGQGIFAKYLKADGDAAEGKRTGGFGSTDEN